MGTLGAPALPGAVRAPDWERAQSEQIIYLSDTGVDFFLLHHVTRLADALTITRRVKDLTDAAPLAGLWRDGAGGAAEEGAAA